MCGVKANLHSRRPAYSTQLLTHTGRKNNVVENQITKEKDLYVHSEPEESRILSRKLVTKTEYKAIYR